MVKAVVAHNYTYDKSRFNSTKLMWYIRKYSYIPTYMYERGKIGVIKRQRERERGKDRDRDRIFSA